MKSGTAGGVWDTRLTLTEFQTAVPTCFGCRRSGFRRPRRTAEVGDTTGAGEGVRGPETARSASVGLGCPQAWTPFHARFHVKRGQPVDNACGLPRIGNRGRAAGRNDPSTRCSRAAPGDVLVRTRPAHRQRPAHRFDALVSRETGHRPAPSWARRGQPARQGLPPGRDEGRRGRGPAASARDGVYLSRAGETDGHDPVCGRSWPSKASARRLREPGEPGPLSGKGFRQDPPGRTDGAVISPGRRSGRRLPPYR